MLYTFKGFSDQNATSSPVARSFDGPVRDISVEGAALRSVRRSASLPRRLQTRADTTERFDGEVGVDGRL